MTVLTRASKPGQFDSRAQVTEVDYNSVESLKSALAGHDVVVNTLGAIPKEIHLRLIDAAASAQVQRFIPSEFGCNTTNANAAKLPVYADKVAIQQYLEKISHTSNLTYTIQANGPFLDWGLMVGFLVNLSGPATDLYDGGERKFSATTLRGVGKGICGIIHHLEVTKNRVVYISEAEVSQSQLLELSGKSPHKRIVQTDDLEKEAFAELGKPSPNPEVFVYNFLKRTIFGGGFGSLFPAASLWNDQFGIRPLTSEELQQIVSKYSK